MKNGKLARATAMFFALMLCFTILSRAADQLSVAVVTTERPQNRMIEHAVKTSGRIVQNQELAVTTLPDQRVTAIYVREGQRVAKGDLLFEVDTSLLEEKILDQQQEMEKQELQVKDAKSQKEVSAQQKANAQAQAAEQYSLSTRQAGVQLARAKQQLDQAKTKLKKFKKSKSRKSGGTGAEDSDVEDALLQTLEDKTNAYVAAQGELRTLEWEIENAVYTAKQEAMTASSGATLTAEGKTFTGAAEEPIAGESADAGVIELVDAGAEMGLSVIDAGEAELVDAGAEMELPVIDAGEIELVDAGTAELVDAGAEMELPVIDAGEIELLDAGAEMELPVIDAGEIELLDAGAETEPPAMDMGELTTGSDAALSGAGSDLDLSIEVESVSGGDAGEQNMAPNAENQTGSGSGAAVENAEVPDSVIPDADVQDMNSADLDAPDLDVSDPDSGVLIVDDAQDLTAPQPGMPELTTPQPGMPELTTPQPPASEPTTPQPPASEPTAPQPSAPQPPTQEELAQIEQTVRDNYSQELAAAQQKVNDAQAEKEAAEAALMKYQQEQLSADRSEDAQTAQQLAADVKAAQQAYEDAALAANEASVTSGRAVATANIADPSNSSDRMSEITYEQMELTLEKLEGLKEAKGKVCAEADGMITKINVMTGEKTADTTALLMADLSKGYRFTADITKEQQKYIGTGDLVSLTSGDGKQKLEELPVESVAADENDEGVYHVTVQIPEDTFELGMNVSLDFSRKSEAYSVTVPLSALHLDSKQQPYVLVAEEYDSIMGKENRARKVSVTVLEQNESYAALAEGVIGSETEVIVQSDKAVDAGSRVRVE